MQLPFTPTFFKKLDIYQQLVDYERAEKKNSTWHNEKIFLKWATSSENTSKGSRITRHSIKDVLDKYSGKQVLLEDAHEVLNGLAMRGFVNISEDRESGFLNDQAFIAGRIITETKNLKNKIYDCWIFLWWIIFLAGVLLLVVEVVVRFKDLGYFTLK